MGSCRIGMEPCSVEIEWRYTYMYTLGMVSYVVVLVIRLFKFSQNRILNNRIFTIKNS